MNDEYDEFDDDDGDNNAGDCEYANEYDIEYDINRSAPEVECNYISVAGRQR